MLKKDTPDKWYFCPMSRDLRIIFMGTPDFAVPSLAILVEHGYNIVAVITAPDKPAGRGLQVQMSPVKQYALSKNIPVLQPEKLKNPDFLQELKSYNANLQIVVAFRMLPEAVWNMPGIGTFNLHASLLPDYRGAAPINWAVINGEKESGVTTFFLQHEIDTGDIIFQEKVAISDTDTAGTLHDKLSEVGSGLVLKTVNAIAEGEVKTTPQAQSTANKKAPKIFKDDCRINWDLSVGDIYNFIRGLSPYPGAWTYMDEKTFKIYSTAKEQKSHTDIIGHISTDGKDYIKIAVRDGYIHLLEVQLEGKKRMPVAEFLRGYTIKTDYIR
jgi:methionyl-tRNA formyltransferase